MSLRREVAAAEQCLRRARELLRQGSLQGVNQAIRHLSGAVERLKCVPGGLAECEAGPLQKEVRMASALLEQAMAFHRALASLPGSDSGTYGPAVTAVRPAVTHVLAEG